MKNRKSTKLMIARKMPPLYHSIPGMPFNIQNSQVVQWLISQPEILQYLFDKVAPDHLVYDSVTKKWEGQDR